MPAIRPDAVPCRAVRARRRRALATILLLVAVLGASAALAPAAVLQRGSRGPAVVRLQHALHVGADGVFGRHTIRAVRRFQRRHGLVVDGIVGAHTAAALGIRLPRAHAVRSRRRPASALRVPAQLERIARCESGGNPRAVSAGGTYRGKYQFDRPTWRAIGGHGDPARAAERVQDRLALRLYRARGSTPWPVCGR